MRHGWAAIFCATILAVAPAGAAERLTTEGAALPAVAFDKGGALEARIDAGGDEALEVYAMIRPASSNAVWMRDRDGFWTEWDGDRASLIPSAARKEGDDLVFKLFEAPPKGVSAMTVTLAYRTAAGLKYGWFEAAERSE